MKPHAVVEIAGGVRIPREELTFTAARSGGPGGQNVNKVSTRVTLRFDVPGSTALTDLQKARIRSRLGTRISGEGVLRVVSQGSRSQARNREAAVARLAALLGDALRVETPRTRTRVPPAQKQRRLEEKRQRGVLKRGRGPVHG